MSRQYETSPIMYQDRFTQQVIQPDAKLIETLHLLLDNVPNDTHALMIDHTVATLLRFHDPNRRSRDVEIIRPKEVQS